MYGVECKRTDAPRMTPSIRNAIEDGGLVRVVVIYLGRKATASQNRWRSFPCRHSHTASRCFPVERESGESWWLSRNRGVNHVTGMHPVSDGGQGRNRTTRVTTGAGNQILVRKSRVTSKVTPPFFGAFPNRTTDSGNSCRAPTARFAQPNCTRDALDRRLPLINGMALPVRNSRERLPSPTWTGSRPGCPGPTDPTSGIRMRARRCSSSSSASSIDRRRRSGH